MRKPHAVLFDLDGTLLDTLDDLTAAANYALAEFGHPRRSREEICSFVGNGMTMLVKRAFPANTDESEIPAVIKTFMAYYMEHLDVYTRPYAGMPELVHALHANGVKTAVVSNKAAEAVEKLIDKYFGSDIDLCFGVKELSDRKPSTVQIDRALAAFGLEVSDAVIVGDTATDIETAQAAKMRCISVSWGFRTAGQLESAGADMIVGSVSELAAALDKDA